MPLFTAVAILVFPITLLEARRVQNAQQIFGMDDMLNRTRETVESGLDAVAAPTHIVVDHAQRGFETVAKHTQRGFETVADTANIAYDHISNSTQDAAASWSSGISQMTEDMACDEKATSFAETALTGMCAASDTPYDCVAGSFSVRGFSEPQKDWVRCWQNPPFLKYGEPTCEKAVFDGTTTYVLGCNLCIANTMVCFHWAMWILGLVLACCCCTCGVGLCCCMAK